MNLQEPEINSAEIVNIKLKDLKPFGSTPETWTLSQGILTKKQSRIKVEDAKRSPGMRRY
ncbi:hypothetical protein [Tolypothrix campylonemoides]|uniref:Uncharacterized protein n=1 Tax=Tolypothrix bouteillei VB521301 TaxID=1479485 RepID=A0A0C1R8A4_9CYAN